MEVMRRHFHDDEVYFTEVFRALIKEEDLELYTYVVIVFLVTLLV